MELLHLAYHLSQDSRRTFNKKVICDTLLCRAVYIVTGEAPLIDVDQDALDVLRHARVAAGEWIETLKGKPS